MLEYYLLRGVGMQIKHLEYFRMLLLSLNIASTLCVKNNGLFGDFNEYISTNTSEYDTVDSFIIEDFYDRIEKFLPTFLTLGKDCYYVINCANDANSKTYYEQVCLDLLKIANKCKDVDVEIVESIDETNYVKVIKMKKAGK